MAGRLTKGQVKRAGRILSDESAPEREVAWACGVADEWRLAHREPLEEMERISRDATLAALAERADTALVASRIKRLESIVERLRRSGLRMKLNEMNDIAGCRVVVQTVEDVRRVVSEIAGRAPLKDVNGTKNYIDCPHPLGDGYRGIHLITRHDAPSFALSGLYCETQVRSRLQHAWATALETYDVISRAGLKTGVGDAAERRFFLLASVLFAEREGFPVPQSLGSPDGARKELRSLNDRIRMLEKLRACSGSVTVLSDEKFSSSAYCVLDIDFELQCTNLYTFAEENVTEAESLYFELEQRGRERTSLRDTLLVKVGSMKNLRESYPNYLVDVSFFIDSLNQVLA